MRGKVFLGVAAVATAAALVPVLNGGESVYGVAVPSSIEEVDEPEVALVQNQMLAAAKPRYTNSTTLTMNECPVYLNLPKESPNPSTPHWSKKAKDERGHTQHVGIRYTTGGYAVILDYSRGEAKQNPHWGFMSQQCLTEKRAHGPHGEALGDLRAVGGNGKVKDVTLEAEHQGKERRKEIHLDSVATFRNRPQAFVIGNLEKGNVFVLPTPSCGRHNENAWILGYAPRVGKWGYVQAMHLPACTAK